VKRASITLRNYNHMRLKPHGFFLIDLFVGTYRLSSHARLEAFVIQTKLHHMRLKPMALSTAVRCDREAFYKGRSKAFANSLAHTHTHSYIHTDKDLYTHTCLLSCFQVVTQQGFNLFNVHTGTLNGKRVELARTIHL